MPFAQLRKFHLPNLTEKGAAALGFDSDPKSIVYFS